MTKRYRDAATGAYVTEEYAKENPSTTVAESDEQFSYGWAVVYGDGGFIEVFSGQNEAERMAEIEQIPARKIKYVFVDK